MQSDNRLHTNVDATQSTPDVYAGPRRSGNDCTLVLRESGRVQPGANPEEQPLTLPVRLTAPSFESCAQTDMGR